MPRWDRFHRRVAKHPKSVEELAPWLNAVDEWRSRSGTEVPPPRFLLNLVVPGAEWYWSVGAEVERLEMEWYSGIPFPLPATPSEVVDSAGHVTSSSIANGSPAETPLSTPQSAPAHAPMSPPPSSESENMAQVFAYLEAKYGKDVRGPSTGK